MKRVNLIGISGKMQSGKDTVAAMLLDCLRADWEIKRYADPVKEVINILTGVPVERLHMIEVKNSYLGREWNRPISKDSLVNRPITIRELHTLIGTDAIRNVVHHNAWVNAIFKDYKAQIFEYPEWYIKEYPDREHTEKFYPNWIISDVRFKNEADAIVHRDGILIRIERPSVARDTPIHKHQSETDLDDYNFNHTFINNGSLDALYMMVKHFVNKHIHGNEI
jgi:hypothetical protein